MAFYHDFVALLCFALLITNSQSTDTPNAGIPCGTWIDVVSVLEKGGASTVEAEIPAACSITVIFAGVCEKALQPFVGTIIKGIEDELSPKEICKLMTFC